MSKNQLKHCDPSVFWQRPMKTVYFNSRIVESLLAKRKGPVPVSGDRFGRLIFSGQFGYSKLPPGQTSKFELMCRCVCTCGDKRTYSMRALLRGMTKSCGCLRRDEAIKMGRANAKIPDIQPGLRRRLQFIWKGMMYRCYCQKAVSYKNYGAKGIRVCDEWHSADKFIEWALVNYKPGLSLDRYPDARGDYEPSNARWANRIQQGRNKTNNRLITAWGETKCIAEWIEDDRCIPKTRSAIESRIDRGISAEEALSRPRRLRCADAY